MTETATILLKGFCLLLISAVIITGLLFVVGETVEHFTPDTTTVELPECPPYWKCTPRGSWNDPNCECWEDGR